MKDVFEWIFILFINFKLTFKRFYPCPLSVFGAMNDPFYRLYSSNLWQSGTECYVLKTNVFYKIFFQQVIPSDLEIF